MLPDQNKSEIWLPNSYGKKWSGFYPNGDRPEPNPGEGILIARADWSLHGLVPTAINPSATWSNWNGGTTSSVVDDYFRLQYSDTSNDGAASGGLSLHLDEIAEGELFIEFKARQPLPQKIGMKFCKVFGSTRDGYVDYCNTTYGLEGSTGEFARVSFGDGNPALGYTGNDTHSNIWYNGGNPTWIGRSYGLATVNLKIPAETFEWDDQWHTFKIHHKFHTGHTLETEVNDGEYSVQIDGASWLHATGVFNRHWSNDRNIYMLNLGDWAQNQPAGEIHFKDVNISIGGFL